MNKLIIVRGIGQIGKTSTLDALFKKLVSVRATLIYPSSIEEYEYFAIFTIKNKRVGIITIGDPGSWPEIYNCLNQCFANNCDTVFCASRTSGTIYNNLYSFATNHKIATIETSPLFARDYWNTGINIEFLHAIFADMLYNLI